MASGVLSARVARGVSLGALAVVVSIMLVLAGYAGLAYSDALRDAPTLAKRADALIASGSGPQTVGLGRLEQVIRLKDPNFWNHNGVDSAALGVGGATITQSLVKPATFDLLVPSVFKLRQSAYAFALEKRLNKVEILALYLDEADMGQGKAGPLRGLFAASKAAFGRAPGDLSDQEWLSLLAAVNGPMVYHPGQKDAALAVRAERVGRLVSNECQPLGAQDLALDGCIS